MLGIKMKMIKIGEGIIENKTYSIKFRSILNSLTELPLEIESSNLWKCERVLCKAISSDGSNRCNYLCPLKEQETKLGLYWKNGVFSIEEE